MTTEDSPAAPSSSDCPEKHEAIKSASELLAQGKRNMVCGEIPQAVNLYQNAVQLLVKSCGEMSRDCADAYFCYGSALLDLGRMETNVLGVALEGVEVEEEKEEAATEQFEKPPEDECEERQKLRVEVYDAMAEGDREEEMKKIKGSESGETIEMETNDEVEGSVTSVTDDSKVDKNNVSTVEPSQILEKTDSTEAIVETQAEKDVHATEKHADCTTDTDKTEEKDGKSADEKKTEEKDTDEAKSENKVSISAAEDKAEEKDKSADENKAAEDKTEKTDNKPAEDKTEETDRKSADAKTGEKDSKPTEDKTEETDNKSGEDKTEEKDSKSTEDITEETDGKSTEDKTEEKDNKSTEDKTEEKDNKSAEDKTEEKDGTSANENKTTEEKDSTSANENKATEEKDGNKSTEISSAALGEEEISADKVVSDNKSEHRDVTNQTENGDGGSCKDQGESVSMDVTEENKVETKGEENVEKKDLPGSGDADKINVEAKSASQEEPQVPGSVFVTTNSESKQTGGDTVTEDAKDKVAADPITSDASNNVEKSDEPMEAATADSGTVEQANNKASENQDMEMGDNDDDSNEEEDDENEEVADEEMNEKNGDEDTEEDVPNFQLAWEYLDLAKVLYLRSETREDQLKAAECYIKLGELSMETEQHATAAEDLKSALKIQQELLPIDDRVIAETNYQLGLAFGLGKEYELAVQHYTQAIRVIEDKIESLKKLVREKGDDGENKENFEVNEQKKYTSEIEELQALIPDIKIKIEDTKEEIKEMEQIKQKCIEALGLSKEAGLLAEADADGASMSGCVEEASDITHLVRKKRKPEDDAQEPEDAGVKKIKCDDPSSVHLDKTVNGSSEVIVNAAGDGCLSEQTNDKSVVGEQAAA